MRENWTLIRRIRRGHSYWRRAADGAVGIADDSGTYPKNCEPADRPPILLDRSRPVTLGAHGCSIPVRHGHVGDSFTPASGFEALWVATIFGLDITAIEDVGATPLRVAVVDVAALDAKGAPLAVGRSGRAGDAMSDNRCTRMLPEGVPVFGHRCGYNAVTKGLCADHGGARDAILLNYIGEVDRSDVGNTRFKLSELFSTADLANGDDQEMELSVELVTENTGGALAARVRLKRISISKPMPETAHTEGPFR